MKEENFDSGQIYTIKHNKNVVEIVLNKPVVLENAADYENSIKEIISVNDFANLIIDFSNTTTYDSYLVIYLNSIKQYCKKSGIFFETKAMSGEMETFINNMSPPEQKSSIFLRKRSFWDLYFSHIGTIAVVILTDSKHFIEFLGDMILKTFNLIIHPSRMRWKDFPMHFSHSGVNAVPIVILIVFLIGLISGYQGSIQLKQFGADIHIADLIGISITRELGPLMTAILVAGRSGSAFAAEIGTMKVSEEIDALKSMGFDYIQFLVLPRVIAVTVAMPLLTMLANIAGILGGLVSALAVLNVTVTGYFAQLQSVLEYSDIMSGLIKSIIFGFLVATIGCFRGLQVSGGAESVGRYTTISVVSGVLLIILSDAVFTFLFRAVGL